MADIYVSPTGDDSTGDGSSGNPYKHIHKAIDEISGDGDVIICKDGTYDEEVGRSFSNSVTIESESEDFTKVIVKPLTTVTINGFATFWHIAQNSQKDVHLKNLTIQFLEAHLTNPGGTIGANVLFWNDSTAYFGSFIVDHCFCLGDYDTATYYHYMARGYFTLNNTFESYKSTFRNFYNANRDLTVTAYDTIYEGNTVAIRNGSYTGDYNCFYNNGTNFSSVSGGSLQTNDIDTDPDFVASDSAVTGDSSTCVDEGTTVTGYVTSYYGDAPDIGVYEAPPSGEFWEFTETLNVADNNYFNISQIFWHVTENVALAEGVDLLPHYPWWDVRGQTIEPACCYCSESTTNVSGLDHLEGQVVAIIANGELFDEQVVINGSVEVSQTPDWRSMIHVGLPYYADLETLKLNVPLGDNPGTVQGLRMKVGNVSFHLRDTKGGKIGPDEDSLYEAFTVQALNQYSGQNISETDLYTGKFRAPLGGEYGYGGHIFIRQEKPFPLTIGSVIPEVDIGGVAR